MSVQDQIDGYLASLPPAKRQEMQDLHQAIRAISPGSRQWFLDGRDETGRVVSNPNIGYGATTITYADGASRAFYRIGLSANTAGISLYIMGIEDRTELSRTYGDRIGKAKVTGYCIKFRSLRDIRLAALKDLIAHYLG